MAKHQHLHRHYHYVEREPEVPFWQVCVVLIMLIFLGFLVASIVTGYFWLFVALLLGYLGLPAAIGAFAYYSIRNLFYQHKQRSAHRNKLIADADEQHEKFMSGDDAGMYGNYPPAR